MRRRTTNPVGAQGCLDNMSFTRKCPKCGKALYYACKRNLQRAIENKSVCNFCAMTDERKRKISESTKGENHPFYGKTLSEEHKQKLSESGKRRVFPIEHKKNIRLARIANIEKKYGRAVPNYNPEACRIIEKYGQQHGFNFQHAENGGEFHIKELGFWIDGYDVEKNVVIEIDESHHMRQKEKDKQRQQEITEHLGCDFIRIQI